MTFRATTPHISPKAIRLMAAIFSAGALSLLLGTPKLMFAPPEFTRQSESSAKNVASKPLTIFGDGEFNFAGRDLIAYASQGPANSYVILKEQLDKALGLENHTYRLFFHSYDRNCDGCIFEKGTSFTQGKNHLVKAVVNSPDLPRFKYVALFDDDIRLFHRTLRMQNKTSLLDRFLEHKVHPQIMRKHIRNGGELEHTQLGWKTFHSYLLSNTTTHPLLKPAYDGRDFDDPTDTFQSCTDEAFWVIRPDHLPLLYPYMTVHDNFFWLNAAVVQIVLERCFPAGFKVLHDWFALNPEHRYQWPDSTYYNTTYKLIAQEEYLEKRLPQLKPWRLPVENPFGFLGARCTVKLAPSQGVHHECSKWTNLMFQEWLNGNFTP